MSTTPAPGTGRTTPGSTSSGSTVTTSRVTTSTTSTPLPPTPPPEPSAAELKALAVVLDAELAAVYGYGVVGGHVRASRRTEAADRLGWHALNRDAVSAQLSLAGRPASPGPAAYALPFAVDSDESARALASHLELGVAAAYADLAAAAGSPRRATAARALGDCALAAQRWGAVVGPFPGLPERSG